MARLRDAASKRDLLDDFTAFRRYSRHGVAFLESVSSAKRHASMKAPNAKRPPSRSRDSTHARPSGARVNTPGNCGIVAIQCVCVTCNELDEVL